MVAAFSKQVKHLVVEPRTEGIWFSMVCPSKKPMRALLQAPAIPDP